jgi:glycosyltransferase involved in cell wall biosynthesis
MTVQPTRARPKVLIVGSEDVDARLDLMRGLDDAYHVAAAGTRPELAKKFADAGYTYFHYPMSRGVAPLGDVRALVTLYLQIARFAPHIVHAYDTKPGVYACLAASLAGVPVIIGTVTGLGSLYERNDLRTRVIRLVYELIQRLSSARASQTMFQNRQDLEQFVARHIVPAAKAIVIPGSGVVTAQLDPARFSADQREQLRHSLNVPSDGRLVTLVARLIRSKGVCEFAEAARLVRRQMPAARFLLVGAADHESVDRLTPAEIEKLSEVVSWVGPRRDIPELLAASDLFVLPSYLREGIPRSLLEAAAMGLPIITTDSPGCNDVVQHGGNGLLVPPRDAAALAEAILSLLPDPDLCHRFGAASRHRAVEQFDLAVVVRKTRDLFDKLLNESRRERSNVSRALALTCVPGTPRSCTL